ncbi:MAG: hypothetical protein Q8L78_00985 [Coxiellaceae bacterium]|nr:hypothetical protein [Coxiellaceae bacterium]
MALQVSSALSFPTHYATADSPTLQDHVWIQEQWIIGRSLLHTQTEALLILNEVQKVQGWSEIVKRLWDEDKKIQLILKYYFLVLRHYYCSGV